jgi:Thiol-disulfide isomerase and thioredoxins
MTQKMKLILGIALLAVIIAGATVVYKTLGNQISPKNDIGLAESDGSISESDSQKQEAPDFTMTDSSGNSVSLSEIIAKGKPIVLNFWASWCPPCKDEMPEFDIVYKELGDEIQFMMVDVTDGQRETVEMGTNYVKEQGFSFPVYFDTAQDGAYTYGINSIPTTLFIDNDGYIITGVQGRIDEKTLRKAIDMIR